MFLLILLCPDKTECVFGEIKVRVDEAGPCIPEIMRKSFIHKISKSLRCDRPELKTLELDTL